MFYATRIPAPRPDDWCCCCCRCTAANSADAIIQAGDRALVKKNKGKKEFFYVSYFSFSSDVDVLPRRHDNYYTGMTTSRPVQVLYAPRIHTVVSYKLLNFHYFPWWVVGKGAYAHTVAVRRIINAILRARGSRWHLHFFFLIETLSIENFEKWPLTYRAKTISDLMKHLMDRKKSRRKINTHHCKTTSLSPICLTQNPKMYVYICGNFLLLLWRPTR